MYKFVVLVFVVLAGPAAADDVSPWFGNEGQAPFQLVPEADAVGFVETPDEEASSRSANACAIESCSMAEGSAKVLGADMVSP